MSGLIRFLSFIVLLFGIDGKISDQRLCGDPNCSEPVSLGKTLLRYVSDDARILSFSSNVDAKIFSKSAGSRTDLWGVEIGGKRGYAPQAMLREFKILKKNLNYVVATESEGTSEPTPNLLNSVDVAPNLDPPPVPSSGVSAEQIVPDTAPLPAEILRPYEVHDGTTFYYTPSGDDDPPPSPIHASTTDTNLKPSAVDAVPLQVDQPDASMGLPSPATSSNEAESLDVAPIQQEESSKGIYNYISSFLPGDGSGSKESVQESTEEYEDDEDYEEDEEGSSEELEKYIEEPQKLDQDLNTIDDFTNRVDSVEAGSDDDPDSSLVMHETEAAASATDSSPFHFADSTSAPATEAPAIKDEATLSKATDIGAEVSVNEVVNSTADEADESRSADQVAQVSDNSELNNVASDVDLNQLEGSQTSGNDSGTSDVEMVSNHEAEVISENVNIMNSDTEPIETHPPSVESTSNGDTEVPAVHQSPSVDVQQNTNSRPDLAYELIDQNRVDSATPENSYDATEKLPENSVDSATTESSYDATEKLPENSVDEFNIQREPPSRGIFDLLSNRDGALEVATDVPPPTGGSEAEQTTQVPVFEPPASDNNTDAGTLTFTSGEESSDTSLDKTVIIDTLDQTDQSDSTYLSDNNSVVESEDGIFSGITSFLSSIPSVFTSWPSSASPPEDVHLDETEPPAKQPAASEEAHKTDLPTDTLSVPQQQASNVGEPWDRAAEPETDHTFSILPSLSKVVDDMSAMPDLESNGPAVSLLITALTVLLFTLGYYLIEKSRRDSTFIAKINSLERTLFISTKECQLLKDDLDTTKGMLTDEHTSLATNETLTDELYAELEERRAAAVDFEDQIRTLQLELDAATDAGLEVNRMLTEVLAQSDSNSSLFESFENLQSQLKSQQNTIINMSDQLQTKAKEILELEAKVKEADEMVASLRAEIVTMNRELDELLLEKRDMEYASKKEHKLLSAQIEAMQAREDAQVENSHRRINFLEEQLEEAETALSVRESEVHTLKACLTAVKLDGSGETGIGATAIQALLDVGLARAELAAAKHDAEVLMEKLKEEQGARTILEDHNRRIQEELNSLQEAFAAAELNAAEANTKLQVLSKYFEEKEASLQKDLGAKESESLRSTGEAMTTQDTLNQLTKQNQDTLAQNDTLRQEILEQERQRKELIKVMDTKYNDAWLSARQFERKLEEARLESATLRNLLTSADRSASSQLNLNAQLGNQAESADRLAGDLNGDLPTSPLHMGHAELPIFPPFVSPHLGGAIPFMPPPSYPQDRRPPPLGCMSSPPLLPPPPPGHYARHYDRHSPDRHSPDRPLYRGGRPAGFRPLRPTTHKSKGSYPGSSHSSESLDIGSNQQED